MVASQNGLVEWLDRVIGDSGHGSSDCIHTKDVKKCNPSNTTLVEPISPVQLRSSQFRWLPYIQSEWELVLSFHQFRSEHQIIHNQAQITFKGLGQLSIMPFQFPNIPLSFLHPPLVPCVQRKKKKQNEKRKVPHKFPIVINATNRLDKSDKRPHYLIKQVT